MITFLWFSYYYHNINIDVIYLYHSIWLPILLPNVMVWCLISSRSSANWTGCCGALRERETGARGRGARMKRAVHREFVACDISLYIIYYYYYICIYIYISVYIYISIHIPLCPGKVFVYCNLDPDVGHQKFGYSLGEDHFNFDPVQKLEPPGFLEKRRKFALKWGIAGSKRIEYEGYGCIWYLARWSRGAWQLM